jgi:hypothetical protein
MQSIFESEESLFISKTPTEVPYIKFGVYRDFVTTPDTIN